MLKEVLIFNKSCVQLCFTINLHFNLYVSVIIKIYFKLLTLVYYLLFDNISKYLI